MPLGHDHSDTTVPCQADWCQFGHGVTVHTFMSTGEAYDYSQCRDDIKDGDVLWVPGNHDAAVLCSAWPVSVRKDYITDINTRFHVLKPDTTWNQYEDGKYRASARIAEALVGQNLPPVEIYTPGSGYPE